MQLAHPQPSPPPIESVLDGAPDPVITTDAEGRVVQFNRAAESTFGYARSQVLGREVAELVVPHDAREAQRSGLSRVASGGPTRILDTRVQMLALRADGTEIPVELTITQSQHDPVQFTAWIRDLSEVGQAERELALRRVEHDAERMADVGSWSWNTDTDELALSNNLCTLLGIEPTSGANLSLATQLCHPDDRERVERAFEQARRTGALSLEYRVIRPDGRLAYVRQGASVLEWHDGRPARIVGTMQDVTDRHLAEREILAHCAVAAAFGAWRAFDEGALALLSGLGTAMEWDSGAIWIADGEALSCRVFWAGANRLNGQFEATTRELSVTRGVGLVGRAWEATEPIVIVDPSADTSFRRRRVAQLAGIRAVAAFPAIWVVTFSPCASSTRTNRDSRPAT